MSGIQIQGTGDFGPGGIANWAYTQTVECRSLRWVQGDQLEPLPPG